MTPTLFTIGHGNLEATALIALLQGAGVERLVDVRSHPQSKRNPHFDQAPLAALLRAARILYVWEGRALGGLRKGKPESRHTVLPAEWRAYADHMETQLFEEGIARLLRHAQEAPTAILCAETNPDQCHRRFIADYLVNLGVHVEHLLPSGEHRPHRLSPAARRIGQRLIYDNYAQESLF